MDPPKPFTGRLKILFRNKSMDTCPTLSADQVNQIPSKIRDVLFCKDTTEDLGDFGTLVKVTDEKYYGSIIRTLQWITKGEKADFLVSHIPQVRKMDDLSATPFTPSLHADDASYIASQTTHTCFAEELDVYLFSIEFELVELQLHISRKLQSYPVYASEIAMLIKGLYSNGSGRSQHVDPALTRFLADRIMCFRETLVRDKNLLVSLRTCISPAIQFESLLHHASIDKNIMSDALHTLRNGISEVGTAAALLQTFEKRHLNANFDPRPSRTHVEPTSSRRASSSHLSEASDQTGDAVKILNAILRDSRVVRADQDSSGTLLSTRAAGELRPSSQDNRFRVQRGQYLVLIPRYRSQLRGEGTRVVCDQYGEVGELFENLSLTPIQDVLVPLPLPQRGDGNKRPKF